MKIYIHHNRGYCQGVAKAIELAKQHASPNTYSYGNLIHNSVVVNALQREGITPITDLSILKKGDTLIIRAHGAPKSVFDKCEELGVNVIGATCSYVKIIQTRAAKYHSLGYKIVLVGNEKHPEIIGINGWCDNSALFISGEEKIDLNAYDKVLVMFQTTFEYSKVPKVLNIICADSVKTLEVFNTICYTTIDRQNYAHYVSSICDLAIVVGDANSSNTNKLFNIARSRAPKAVLINGVAQLPKHLPNVEKICIIAGASTPKELIEEVLYQMTAKENNGVKVEEVTNSTNMFTNAVDKMPNKRYSYRKGQKLSCKVIDINNEGVYVNLSNTKGDGFIPNAELVDGDWEAVKSAIKVGDVLECIVSSTDKIITLSKKEMDAILKDDELVVGIKEGKSFELVMQKAVKGGLLSRLGSYTVFVPSSHIREGFVKDLDKYVGKKLRLVALTDGVDENKKKIVASQRELLVQERKERDDNFWNNISVNEIREGKVLRFSSFGAFVNIDGFDCLAHLSDLSWSPIKDPAEVLEIGKSYDFVVLKLDRDTKRVSLGYKQLQPHPWVVAAEKYAVGTIVSGKVARILDYGAFVELEKGIDGLLHISNVSWDWLSNINEAIKVGDIIDVKVIEFDLENKRITLSRKETLEKPAEPIKAPREQKDNLEE